MKAWQRETPRGQYINHPSVLNLCSRATLTTEPQRFDDGAITVLAYSRTRLHLDREAWEALPSNGVSLVRICGEDAPPLHFCASRDELDAVFGEVRQTDSWDTYRFYSFRSLPPAARAFFVECPDEVEWKPRLIRSPRKRSAPESVAVVDPVSFVRHCWEIRGPLVQDSEDYLKAISSWREAWRPERIRVLLVAESHVAEASGDSHACVRVPQAVLEATGVSGLPDTYARLVYCLGYGLDSVCDPIPEFPNPGTVFWEIFERLASGHPLLMDGAQPRSPVHRRILVLQALRERGIWLVDASVVALYHPSGIKLFGPSMRKTIIQQSYQQFVWPSVEADKPEAIWVIGKEVGKALRKRPEIDQVHVISQPGDRRREEYQNGLARMTESILRFYR